MTEKRKEIQEHRERLWQAELTKAIESSRAMVLVVSVDAGPRLGPTMYAPVAVDGVTTDALVDTDHSLSLEFPIFRNSSFFVLLVRPS